jgi:putative peptide zinc metalloprotease protein
MNITENTKLRCVNNLLIRKNQSRWGFYYYIVRNRKGCFYWMSEEGYQVWQHLLSEITFGELVHRVSQEYSKIELEQLKAFILELFAFELIMIDGRKMSDSFSPFEKRKRNFELKKFFATDKLNNKLHKIHSKLKWMLSDFFKKISLILLLILILITAQDVVKFYQDPIMFQILDSYFLGTCLLALIVILPVSFLHELSHAIICVHYKLECKKMGIGLFYLIPYFFTDTTDTWILDKNKKIWVSLIGPLSTLTIGLLLFLFSHIVPSSYVILPFIQSAGFFCIVMFLFNLCPFVESDGYYVLMDVLDIPNLRENAFQLLANVIGHHSTQVKLDFPIKSFKIKIILLLFAWSCIFWSILLFLIGFKWSIVILQELCSLLVAVPQQFSFWICFKIMAAIMFLILPVGVWLFTIARRLLSYYRK